MARVKQVNRRGGLGKKKRVVPVPAPNPNTPYLRPGQIGYTRKRAPGAKALLEIRKYQKSTCNLLRKGPFSRLVREVACDFKSELKFTRTALEVVQIATEQYIVQLFEKAQALAYHRRRQTISQKDIQLVMWFETGEKKAYNRVREGPQTLDTLIDPAFQNSYDKQVQARRKKKQASYRR